MADCPKCGLEYDWCEHGLKAQKHAVALKVDRLEVTPQGKVHVPGACTHKEGEDYAKWGYINTEQAWLRLGNNESLTVDEGAPRMVGKVMTKDDRCRDCMTRDLVR